MCHQLEAHSCMHYGRRLTLSAWINGFCIPHAADGANLRVHLTCMHSALLTGKSLLHGSHADGWFAHVRRMGIMGMRWMRRAAMMSLRSAAMLKWQLSGYKARQGDKGRLPHAADSFVSALFWLIDLELRSETWSVRACAVGTFDVIDAPVSSLCPSRLSLNRWSLALYIWIMVCHDACMKPGAGVCVCTMSCRKSETGNPNGAMSAISYLASYRYWNVAHCTCSVHTTL